MLAILGKSTSPSRFQAQRAWNGARAFLAGGLLLWACSAEPEGGALAISAPEPPPSSELERVLGPFLSSYWQLPVPAQGEPAEEASPAERSLDPAVCGACHPKQFAEWRTSLHAAAFSPGFAGQLIEGELAAPSELRACQRCHAPLTEQQPVTAQGDPEPAFDPSLRRQGVLCAACHVRLHRRYGPPRRAGLPPLAQPLPHGGFEERPEFLESRFCAVCHQFFDAVAPNGKPIENTYVEWTQSPQAAAGKHCQDCHMPDRAHLWRGIHDPDMVREAIEVELFAGDLDAATLRATLVLANRGVGHAFPTYVTPRVELAVFQVGAAEVELPETRIQALIGREVDLGSMTERFDTRVLPGESVRLDYVRPRHPDATALLARVTVDPDYHYRGVLAALRATLRDAKARAQIETAIRRISDSSYVLTEIRRDLAGD
ncbi:MAG: multiheme c-type cytochrome [Myxococcota bacterium]